MAAGSIFYLLSFSTPGIRKEFHDTMQVISGI
jgi:hypothetical protein